MQTRSLTEFFQEAERRWLRPLYAFCEEQFKAIHLPSHDHSHHLRVWIRARELLRALHDLNIQITAEDVEKILIAVFFHDVGMTVSIQKRHGIESKRICESFFKKSFLEIPVGFEEILDAIEQHDNKCYDINIIDKCFKKNTLSILSISDDLDAFGFIGVYRYAEIYSRRRIPVDKLAELVRNSLNMDLVYKILNQGMNGR